MVLSQEIIDNPKLGFYQMVYGFGLIILLTWNFLYSRNFMKVRDTCHLLIGLNTITCLFTILSNFFLFHDFI